MDTNTHAIASTNTSKKSKKKAIILIASGVTVFLIALTVILVLVLQKDYIEKTKFDHVSSVSYNDVRIVGSDGLFYLCRGEEIISEGYVSLRSVNDGYADAAPHWLEAEDTLLFDYYIARRAQQSQYLLVTSAGEEYKIVGNSYSLAEIRLPYLIFVNNTTGRRASLSLLNLDSDLSRKAGNELTLNPFFEITPVREHAETALYSHLEVKDVTAENPYAVFTDEGKLILSAKSYEKKIFVDDEEHASVYYVNNDTHTVYSSRGEVLAVGAASVLTVSDEWGYLPLALDEQGVPTGMAVLSYQKSYSITDAALDFSAPEAFDGSLALPVKDSSDVVLYTAADGASTRYTSLAHPHSGLLCATQSGSTDTLYLAESGKLLLRTPYADMTLDTALSSDECLVFASAEYDATYGSLHHLHVTREGATAVTATIESGVTVSRLYANDGAEAVEGVFLLQSLQDGLPSYRLLAPFSSRLFSDTYDRIEIFSSTDILWARGTRYAEKSYTFLDPIGGQITETVYAADEEEFSKLLFEFADCKSLLADPHDSDSAVPVLLLRLSCREEDGLTSSIRYFALYRALPASSPNFDSGTLRVLEVGKNLLRAEPVSFFPEDNTIVCRNTDFSHVYRLNESYILSEVATLPYRVSRVISDRQNPTVKYFEVTTDDGKYGLYDASAAPILSPYYDKIWAVNDGHFVVSLRGAMGVLSYEDNELRQVIDYRYANIYALPDHGYLAADGNENMYLFDGKKKIASDAVQSYQTLTSYSLGENGSIRIGYSLLISMKGHLWLHESDVRIEPLAASPQQPTNVYQSIENERPIAIYYHHGNDVIDVGFLYPSPEHQAAFSLIDPPVGNGWYTDPKADPEAIAPMTVPDIVTSGKHIVKLYTVQ